MRMEFKHVIIFSEDGLILRENIKTDNLCAEFFNNIILQNRNKKEFINNIKDTTQKDLYEVDEKILLEIIDEHSTVAIVLTTESFVINPEESFKAMDFMKNFSVIKKIIGLSFYKKNNYLSE